MKFWCDRIADAVCATSLLGAAKSRDQQPNRDPCTSKSWTIREQFAPEHPKTARSYL